MRITIGILALVLSLPCHATETLDCMSSPYNVMIHVGHDENDEDVLADIMLYKEGYADPLAIYYGKDLNVPVFKWLGGMTGNELEISSKPGSKVPFYLSAYESHGTIKVYEKEFPIRCYWER